MAISLVAAFKAIPWTDVLAAAPTIVQGAEKLWGTVARKKAETQAQDYAEEKRPPHAETLAQMEARLQTLEARIAEFQSEALSSSALIKSLAEQNAQLVRAVEILRVRTRILLTAGSVVALAALVWALATLGR